MLIRDRFKTTGNLILITLSSLHFSVVSSFLQFNTLTCVLFGCCWQNWVNNRDYRHSFQVTTASYFPALIVYSLGKEQHTILFTDVHNSSIRYSACYKISSLFRIFFFTFHFIFISLSGLWRVSISMIQLCHSLTWKRNSTWAECGILLSPARSTCSVSIYKQQNR